MADGTKKKKSPRKRSTKLTPELMRKFCGLIEEGNYVNTAAALCFVTERAIYNWLDEAQGKRDSTGKKNTDFTPRPETIEFYEKFHEALARSEANVLARIRDAAVDPRNWTAAAWYLERKFPDRWGKIDRAKVEVTGKDGEPLHGVLAVPAAVSVEEWVKRSSEQGSGGGD